MSNNNQTTENFKKAMPMSDTMKIKRMEEELADSTLTADEKKYLERDIKCAKRERTFKHIERITKNVKMIVGCLFLIFIVSSVIFATSKVKAAKNEVNQIEAQSKLENIYRVIDGDEEFANESEEEKIRMANAAFAEMYPDLVQDLK